MSTRNHFSARALLLGALWIVCAVGLVLPVGAQNLVVNGDFSNPAGTPAPGGCVAPNWTWWHSPTSDNASGFWYTGCPYGEQAQRIIQGVNASSLPRYSGGIVQAVPTVANTVYDLEMDLQLVSNTGSVPSPVAAPETFIIEGYFGYDLTGQTTTPDSPTIVWSNRTKVWNTNTWARYLVRFTATSSTTSIWFKSTKAKNGWGFFDIDNVSLTPAGAAGLINNYDPPQPSLQNPSFENATVNVSVDGTSATINWVSDVVSQGSVEYGATAPLLTTVPGSQITYTSVEMGAGLSTTHGVTLTGLQANQIYHYRLVNTAAGSKSAYSRDYTFATGGTHNKTVQPWVLFDVIDGIFGPSANFNTTASHGSYWVASYASSEAKNGGFYQRVAAVPGRVYTLISDFATLAGGGAVGQDEVYIGIDPLGGTDPRVQRPVDQWPIVWNGNGLGPYYCPDPLNDCGQGIWNDPNTFPPKWNMSLDAPGQPTQVSAQIAPNSNVLTAFVVFRQWYPLPFNMTLADNLKLMSTTPVDVTSVGAARAEQDSTVINITSPQVVTLVPVADSGYFYIESPDRSAGIRVEAAPTGLQVGDRVTVSGLLTTNADGERALSGATFTETSSGTPLEPLIMTNKSMGGKGYTGDGVAATTFGAVSEGLLVKVFGQVTDSNFIDTFYIDDGSSVDADYVVPGVKVIRTEQFPSVGDYVAVVGIASSDISSGKKIRVLRGREAQFSSDFETLNP